MNIEINDRDPDVWPSIEQQPCRCHRHVVENTEPGTFPTKGVVSASGEDSGETGIERMPRSGKGATDAREGAIDEARRPGKTYPPDGRRIESSVQESRDVIGIVNPPDFMLKSQRSGLEIDAALATEGFP
jgi:hypothetical protein